MATTEWMLKQPPALCQLQLYKGTEGMLACWATVAEMIAKWKRADAFFARPKFENYLIRTDGQGKAEYLSFVLDWLDAWGFRSQNDGAFGTWTMGTMASYLYWRGPLMATGKFTSGLAADQMHDIAVFGCKNGQVHYVDPMDAAVKQISITSFQDRLWKSHSAVMARLTNFQY